MRRLELHAGNLSKKTHHQVRSPGVWWGGAQFTPFACRGKKGKLASVLLYSWSLLRNNNMAINLQMFTSSYGNRRFAACDQGLPLSVFSTQIWFFSRLACLGYYEKSREICVFWSDKLISNFNVFNNMNITLDYSATHHVTSGENVRIVQSSGSRSMNGDPHTKAAKDQNMGRAESIQIWVAHFQRYHCFSLSVCLPVA